MRERAGVEGSGDVWRCSGDEIPEVQCPEPELVSGVDAWNEKREPINTKIIERTGVRSPEVDLRSPATFTQ